MTDEARIEPPTQKTAEAESDAKDALAEPEGEREQPGGPKPPDEFKSPNVG